MKSEIEAALSVLIGQSLVASSRVGDIETFQFAGQQVGGAFALQVRCPWRLTSGRTIVAGYDDVRYPKGNPSAEPPGFRWDAEGANRRDERLESFFEDHRAAPPTVTSLEADDLGKLFPRLRNFILERQFNTQEVSGFPIVGTQLHRFAQLVKRLGAPVERAKGIRGVNTNARVGGLQFGCFLKKQQRLVRLSLLEQQLAFFIQRIRKVGPDFDGAREVLKCLVRFAFAREQFSGKIIRGRLKRQQVPNALPFGD